MKFIIGEGGWSYLERLTYRGVIGLFYENTIDAILCYLIFAAIILLAVIGLISIIKAIITKVFAPKPYGYRPRKNSKYP